MSANSHRIWLDRLTQLLTPPSAVEQLAATYEQRAQAVGANVWTPKGYAGRVVCVNMATQRCQVRYWHPTLCYWRMKWFDMGVLREREEQ